MDIPGVYFGTEEERRADRWQFPLGFGMMLVLMIALGLVLGCKPGEGVIASSNFSDLVIVDAGGNHIKLIKGVYEYEFKEGTLSWRTWPKKPLELYKLPEGCHFEIVKRK